MEWKQLEGECTPCALDLSRFPPFGSNIGLLMFIDVMIFRTNVPSFSAVPNGILKVN